ncbi:MAG: DMT family transporter [Actinomycetota bacterium]
MRRLAPGLFVVLWSTGFIVARYGTRDAGPLTFLALRTAIAALLLFGLARLTGESRLSRAQVGGQMTAGLGLHAMYLGGVFIAIDLGLASGVSALIAALHPVVTTVGARMWLGERIGARRSVGIALGAAGVVAVVAERGIAGDDVRAGALVAMAIAVIGMAAGTLWQRRTGGDVPLLGGTAWQYVATTVVLGVPALAVERLDFAVTARSVASLAWAVGVLSVAAILTMLWLLKRQAASSVSSLFFLTPALSAIEASVLFDERLGVLSLAGFAAAMVGVWLITSRRAPKGMKHHATRDLLRPRRR